MSDQFLRTELIFGEDAICRLMSMRVAIFGVGGVGGYAVEALARSGIGTLDLFDDDVVCPSNINRQLHATWETVGQYKTDVVCERVMSINRRATVNCFHMFYTQKNANEVNLADYDYVVDAVDTMDAKLSLAERCYSNGIPIISVMGCGNKVDPTRLIVGDIFDTSVCPLARIMRHELRKRNIPKLAVVYSTEKPCRPLTLSTQGDNSLPEATRNGNVRRRIPGSTAFVPAVAGLIAASVVVGELIRRH